MRWSLGKAKGHVQRKFIAWNIFLNIEDENWIEDVTENWGSNTNQSAKAEEEINKYRRIRWYKEMNKDKIKN